MEEEQIQKRVDWLDEERRKDKSSIASLEDRVQALESALAASNKLVQDMSSDLTHLRTVLGKVETVEASVSQVRIETNRSIEELDRVRKDREDELEELKRVQFENIHKQLGDIRKELEQIPEINTQLIARSDEENRLNRKLDELQANVLASKRDDEETVRSVKLIEEGRRRDEKRLTDIQGEVLALRKRAEEQRGKLDLSADTLRRVENRISEISSVEVERREAYTSFVEKLTLAQVERERIWNEWSARIETIEKQAMEFETRVQELHTTQRDVRKAQENVDAVSERVERRINEITEMQRLGDDRFRQEWTTFKADDQKRWTNYTLTQEEQSRDSERTLSRLSDRMTEIEERVQTLDDQVAQINQQTEHRLKRMLTTLRDWVAEYEQVFGQPS